MSRAAGWAVVALLALILLVLVTNNMNPSPIEVSIQPVPSFDCWTNFKKVAP
jgi:hypothetical protein